MDGESGPAGRRRHWGIRARVATLATLVVALTLVVAGAALVALVHQSLVTGLDDSQLARAESIAAQASAGIRPRIPTTARQVSLIQVLDSKGTVVASTANIEGEDPVLDRPPAERRTTTSTLTDAPLDTGGTFRILAQPVTLKSGPGWIYVATSLSQVEAATSNVSILFAIGLPLVLLIVGFTVWRAVALALRPVEQIRRRASEIEAADLSQRLPVPQTRDEIARLSATMNEMLDRLETAATRQKQFVGDASHELRSPLAGLRAQVDVALKHPDPGDLERVLTLVRDEVGRMTMLTEDLLFLAQSTETSPMTLAAPVDLDDLLLAEARRLRQLGGRTITVAVEAARVQGSRRDLSRVLRNLADNAYEHARGEVALTLRTANAVAEITITDDGEGIPPEERETVFERFTRLDPSRPRGASGGGFGLGLAIARQVVLAHAGTLTAHGRPDGRSGTQFLLRIPLSDD